ncbi:MAG: hypothetical protein EOR77_21600 [Mesorhizobium sp.]|uniref:hypothetical protein n=1 Tax=Mesorhizobium sp. TaxID=1871066 RepID=UPI000FE80B02|nr:hypothetical protein [Mesorhizobium sp.]RWH86446.1 MAG: hypothetical protein EOQ87_26505 [Mesorhizobium sp.]RWM32270.1 MAG: hypothetical protein EOR77_21600 [Mesorhizobium sp.]TJV33770.1 MAG: hypothetical protein E5X87_10580 [Mesorhizobium sp.]
MSYIGDFPEDFTTVSILFTTHAASGAAVAPSSGFEAADVKIYKNGSAAEKTSTNGLTMTSPFDGITGLHCLVIDTSVDTGDVGFWVAGAQYTVVLSPDETVDGLVVAKVIGTFGLAMAPVFARVGAPAGASVSADVAAVKAVLPAALVSGRIDASVGAMAANVMTAAAAAADLATELQSGLATAASIAALNNLSAAQVNAEVDTAIADAGLATAANLATVAGYLDTEIAAILADTNELQTDWANGGRLDLILDARASQTSVDDLPTNAELATALAAADDAVLAQVALVKSKTDNLPDDPADQSLVVAATDAVMSRLGAPAGASLSADIAALPTAAALAVTDGKVDGIKAKTDSLTFTVAGKVDANILSVNSVSVTGTGASGDEWGPA